MKTNRTVKKPLWRNSQGYYDDDDHDDDDCIVRTIYTLVWHSIPVMESRYIQSDSPEARSPSAFLLIMQQLFGI